MITGRLSHRRQYHCSQVRVEPITKTQLLLGSWRTKEVLHKRRGEESKSSTTEYV